MTCIAGLVDPLTGDICVGGDSAAVAEYDMLNYAMDKVFIKDGFIFGYAGHFRFGQILEHIFEPPPYHGEDVARYFAMDFSEALRQTCKVLGYGKNKDGRDEGGYALIGFKRRLFLLQDEFDVVETSDGITAIGCGFPYARAALKALSTVALPIQQRVQVALEVSEYYSAGVRAPFTILTLPGNTDVGSAEHHGGNRRRPRSRSKRSTKGSR